MGRSDHRMNLRTGVPSPAVMPIALDIAALSIAVVGAGDAALRRVAALRDAGARWLTYFRIEQAPDPAAPAGVAVEERAPSPHELETTRVVWIVGLEDGAAGYLARQARAAGALVNVEDRPALCDFHNMAEVRRGGLVIAVSTSGASPRLAGRIRGWLAARFGADWGGRVAAIGAARAGWRRETGDLAELSRRTDALLDRLGGLP